jgi:hypothetical protein
LWPTTREVLCALLRNAVARKEVGVNVLLYGPPGTGKTELAKVVAQAAGLELYEVEYADRDGNSLSGRDRYRSPADQPGVPQGQPPGVALLFDEVEDVFPPHQRRGRAADGAPGQRDAPPRQRQRQGLGQPDPRIQPGAGDLGHQPHRADRPGVSPPLCQYHLELKSPPPGAREGLVRKTLDGVAVSEGFVARLAERRKGLTPAQIRTAVRFAGWRSRRADDAEGRAGRSADRAPAQKRRQGAGQPRAERGARSVVTTYDLAC